MGPPKGPPGSCRPQMGPMLVPWTLLSGITCSTPPYKQCIWLPENDRNDCTHGNHKLVFLIDTHYSALIWLRISHNWILKRNIPDSKVHGANMGPIGGRQDPGGSHVGPRIYLGCTWKLNLFYEQDCGAMTEYFSLLIVTWELRK